jgi:uncharacterized membrane protein
MATDVREHWSGGTADSATMRHRADGSPAIVDVETEERLSLGDIVADRVTRELGSWRFIAVYFALLLLWLVVNTVAWMRHWDPYPFIFLNLVLSFQGAFAAPIILMSQNRQEDRDRLAEQYDHAVNLRAEREVAAIQARIEELGRASLAEVSSLRAEQAALHAKLDAILATLEGKRPRDPGDV